MAATVSSWDHPNGQHACPLFAVLSVELRTMVFELALTETVVYPELPRRSLHTRHDHDEPADIEIKDTDSEAEDWFSNGLWPGCEGRTVIYTALLRTCRRVYLETAHLPSWNRETCYAAGIEPPWAVQGMSNN
ncbi:hypothetical protein B0T14DRAFT_566722 [Immersiella caudata]|uniref:DUF7730 domain-containing protein n=1 Tax=Immersiella caudata TaxID=314043 RepID=A0AA39WQW5_9PEZI|nr:hypothetical protein B0T14DRAFT_566722 [Immersiella caudata]